MTIRDIKRLFDDVDKLNHRAFLDSNVPIGVYESKYKNEPREVPIRTRRDVTRAFKYKYVFMPNSTLAALHESQGAAISLKAFRMFVQALQRKYSAEFYDTVIIQLRLPGAEARYRYIKGHTWQGLPYDIGVKYGYDQGYQLYNIVYLTKDGTLGFGHPQGADVEIAYVTWNPHIPKHRPQAKGFFTYDRNNTSVERFIAGLFPFQHQRPPVSEEENQEEKEYEFILERPTRNGRRMLTKHGYIHLPGRTDGKVIKWLSQRLDNGVLFIGEDCVVLYTKERTVVRGGNLRVEVQPACYEFIESLEELAASLDRLLNTEECNHVVRVRGRYKYNVELSYRRVDGISIQSVITNVAARLILAGPDYLDRIKEYRKLTPQYRMLKHTGIPLDYNDYVIPVEIENYQLYAVLGKRRIHVKKSKLTDLAYHGKKHKPLEFVRELGLSISEFLDIARKLKLNKLSPEARAKETLKNFIRSVPWARLQDGNIYVTSTTNRVWKIDTETSVVYYNDRPVCIVDAVEHLPLADRILARVMALRNDSVIASEVWTVADRLKET